MRLKVTVTKTSRGDQDYIQIMSDDMLSVNVVLVADKIEVEDHRRNTKALGVTASGVPIGGPDAVTFMPSTPRKKRDDDVTPDVATRRGPR